MVLPSAARVARHALTSGLVLVAGLTGCGAEEPDALAIPVPVEVLQRLDAVQQAVAQWSQATTLAQAQAAAEATRNLVTGPGVQGYGDANGDGTIGGAVARGLLPDEGAQPGLVPLTSSDCVIRDVLGGSWQDPAGRWTIFREHLDHWRPDNNTFPDLPSHPQRVVGWASLALEADNVAEAVEYSSHALLHVRVSQRVLEGC